MPGITTPSQTASGSPAQSDHATKEAAERQKAAHDNVREGYGSTVKSRHISAKPDGDTQGGPGRNNENATPPAKPR